MTWKYKDRNDRNIGFGGIKVSESVIYVISYYFMVDMSIKKYWKWIDMKI